MDTTRQQEQVATLAAKAQTTATQQEQAALRGHQTTTKRKLLVAVITAAGLYGQSVWAGEYTLTWKPSVGQDGYRLYQSTDMGVTWTKVYEGPTNTAKVNISNPQVYLYAVSAYKGNVESRRSDVGAWIAPSLTPFNGEITVE